MKSKFAETFPDKLEKLMAQKYPDLEKHVTTLLDAKETFSDWPDWCYLPMSATNEILTLGIDNAFTRQYIANHLSDIYMISAMIPWQTSKIVYRFDDALADALMEHTEPCENIPVDMILHLPYPCVFIEQPPGVPGCEGVFVFLESDNRYPNVVELRMHYAFSDGNIAATYFQWGVNETISQQMVEDNLEVINRIKRVPELTVPTETYDTILKQRGKHLNMLLYLMTQDADIVRKSPEPRIRGERRQTAAYSDVLYTGGYVGSAIRKAKTESERELKVYDSESKQETTYSVRPHIRKAHWHLYWTGPGKSIPKTKWILPIFVKGGNADVPTVIRPVKK